MLAVLCPGQGAQTPGMLSPWLELPTVAAHLAALSEATNVDVLTHGTTSGADTIRDTAVAQPLLVAASIATAREVLGGTSPGVVAGHSVGEFAAVAIAGILSDADAMRLVSVRGAAMAAAAAFAEPTSMAAVLGGDDVEAYLTSRDLTPANINGGGQIVAAGAASAIAELVANPPARARVIQLEVAGAFHTAYMAPAVEALTAAASGVHISDPATHVLSNADGAKVTSGADAVARLIRQVASPVRWDLCMDQLLNLGVTGIIEVAPGGVLTGLAKRSLRGIPAVAIKTPDDLPAARELMEAHA